MYENGTEKIVNNVIEELSSTERKSRVRKEFK